MKLAMVMQWDGIKPGHGEAATTNAMRGFELLAQWKDQGKVLSYSTFYGMQRTRNFCVVMVDSHQVMDLVLDPEFVTYCTEASMLWDGFEWSLFQPDEDSQDALQAWAATAAALA